jgi:uncharacterized surface protein with fasciclin (FAS1) repeats
MTKIFRYFLFSSLVLSVLFLASCEEDVEGPVVPSTLELTQGGTIVNSAEAAPGEDVTVNVEITYGDDAVDNLIVREDDGTIFNTFPLTNAPTSVQVTYTVPDDASGTLEVDFELSGPDGTIATETLSIEVSFATVVDIALSSDDFEILVAALTEANLVTTLQGAGPFTVFAPTDDAFAAIGINSAADLPEGDALTQLLLYHVVSGAAVQSTQLEEQAYMTVEGSDVVVRLDGGVFVNDAEVVTADLVAGNGVVHVIDMVLDPASSLIFDEAVLLGGQSNTTLGSFYNVIDTTVYTSSEAAANSAMVDFAYWYVTDNDPATADSEAIIGSPDADSFAAAFSGTTLETENSTRFLALQGVTAADFEGIVSATDFDDVFDGDFQGGGAVRLTNLQENQVFGIQLDEDRGGNVGLVRVVEITGAQGSERAITIQVKFKP